jgi:hypothetical protein
MWVLKNFFDCWKPATPWIPSPSGTPVEEIFGFRFGKKRSGISHYFISYFHQRSGNYVVFPGSRVTKCNPEEKADDKH